MAAVADERGTVASGRVGGTGVATVRPGLRWAVLVAVAIVPVAVIVSWRAVALVRPVPHLFQVLDTIVVVASLVVVVLGVRLLRPSDVGVAATAGALLGLLVPHTGFYPLLAWTCPGASDGLVALLHGTGVALALLGGIVVLRRGGPVRFGASAGAWKTSLAGFGTGAAIGLPLAVVNAYANTLVQGRPFVWQAPGAPLLEALEPGLVEEVVYRFALLGIVWLVLRPFWGRRSAALAGVVTLLVHAFAHAGDLLLTDPATYLGFGIVLALVWGVPATVLALRRDLENAAGFHWIQDAVRFLGGL